MGTVLVAVIGAFGLVFLLLMYGALSWGFVMFKFYNWFLLPVFVTLPTITFIQSIGVMMFIGLFCRYAGEGLKDDYKDKTSQMTTAILAPWVTLFAGWLVTAIWF